MFGTPIGNGDAGVNGFLEGFINQADSGFPKLQRKEIFYSVKDGNWNDPTVWQTASGKVGLLPSAIDDVYVRNNIFSPNGVYNVNHLFISRSGRLSVEAGNNYAQFNINGNLKSYGIIDTRVGTGFGMGLHLRGVDNFINDYIIDDASSTTRIVYERNGDQPILPLRYRRLVVFNSGTKYLTGNTNVTFNFEINSGGTIDLLDHDFITENSSQQSLIFNGSTFQKSFTSGQSIFEGSLQLQSSRFNITGNADLEFRNGIVFYTGNTAQNTGTGTWKFTTRNQSIIDFNSNSVVNYTCSLFIQDGLTLTLGTGSGTRHTANLFNSVIAGGATSNLINRDTLNFANQTAIDNFLLGGQFNLTTVNSTVSFSGNYSATIAPQLNTFRNLTISGTGTKTAGADITVNGNLVIGSPTATFNTFDAGNFNLTVLGTTNINNQSSRLSKSGSGNVLFVGVLNIGTEVDDRGTLDFSAGNPNVECRGGIRGHYQATSPTNEFKSGTGTWSFTTNNQTLVKQAQTVYEFQGPVIIGSNVTVTIADHLWSFRGTVEGANSNSTLINKGTILLWNNNTIMNTGILDIVNFPNEVAFLGTQAYSLPYSSFRTLSVGGLGVKSLSANTTVNGA